MSSIEPTTSLTAAANRATADDLGELPNILAAHYDGLRALAGRVSIGESPSNSLNPTALVHEAFLRLLDRDQVTQRGMTFFRGCFARECRRILVDHARARAALRRGGGRRRESRLENVALANVGDFDLLDLHEAIESLIRLNERMGHVVELRLFGNLTIPECAEMLGISPRTVDKDWKFALTWLRRELG